MTARAGGGCSRAADARDAALAAIEEVEDQDDDPEHRIWAIGV